MKTHSKIFVLFLVSFAFISTCSWAQTYSVQLTNELAASQDAHRLGEELQRNQAVISEARKGENRSMDAMHWTVVRTSQQSQALPAVNKQLIDTQKVAPLGVSIYKKVDKPIKTTEKPVSHSL